MSVFRFGLLALVFAVLLIGQSSAQNSSSSQLALEDPLSLLNGKDGQSAPFQSKPARQMMSEEEYTIYIQMLSDFDCKNANWVLNRAFVRQYPQYERARLKPNCGDDRDCRKWSSYVSIHFDGYAHCTAMVSWNKVERELRQRNIEPPEFRWPGLLRNGRQKREVYNNNIVEDRDRALAKLIFIAENNYAPSLIKLAALVRRGGVFNADGEIEYYILRRACLFGDDCAIISPRLAELYQDLAPDRIAIIEKKARIKVNSQLVLRSLLLGGKL